MKVNNTDLNVAVSNDILVMDKYRKERRLMGSSTALCRGRAQAII